MNIIETQDGLIAFDTGDTKHDGELMLEAIISVGVLDYSLRHTFNSIGQLRTING
jgi:hypothetical protein